jgi:uncharacterized protein YegP (UPF0339 family)
MMRKFGQALVLGGVMAVVAALAGLPGAPAQDKGSKSETKAQPKAEAGVVEVYQAKDGWRFRIKNAEGKSVAIGTVGFEKKEDCLKVLELVKTTLATTKIVELTEAKKEEKKETKKEEKKK